MPSIRARGLCFSIALAAVIGVGPAGAFAESAEPTPAAVDEAADRLAPRDRWSPAIAPPPPGLAPAAGDLGASVTPALDAVPQGSLDIQATVPPPRVASAAIVDTMRHRLIVFGGYYNTNYQFGPYLNDVWALPLAGPPAWSQLAPAGDSLAGGLPAVRVGHTAIYDPVRERMIVFGGTGSGNFNDVWALSLSGEPAWSRLVPAGTPPLPRLYASAIYDPVRDRMIVFGGVSLYELHNDVWALSLSGTPTWSLIEPPGERPAGRYLHTAVYDAARDRLVICGGVYGDNDVWALPLSGASPWERVGTSGSSPLPRTGHSAIYDAVADRMVLFGGSAGGYRLNDTWSLPLAGDPVWSRVTSSTPPPAERSQHVAACDAARARLVVFGGQALSDTWVLPLQGAPSWSMIQPVDAPGPMAPVPTFTDTISGIPSSVYVGQAFNLTAIVRNDGVASDDGRIVIGFPSLADPADIAAVSSASNGDSPGFRVHPAGSGIEGAACEPMAASYLVAEYADDAWAEFGGETQRLDLRVAPRAAGTFYVEVRSTMRAAGGGACDRANGLPANGDSGTVDQQGWAVKRFAVTVLPLPPPGSEPVRRRLHSAVYDPARNRMLVFGGWVGAPNAETWALSLDASPTWSLLLTDAPPTARYGHASIYDPVRDRLIVFGGFDDVRRNDVWALSLSGPPAWTRIDPSGTQKPAPRRYHSAIYDPVRDRMIIFGGSANSGSTEPGTDMNDVWALDLADPRWTNLSSSGPSWRKYHAAAYDPVRDQMLVYGGLLGIGTRYDDLWALSLSGSPHWTRVDPLGESRPSPRSGHTLTYDPVRDRMWMVGGNSGAYENDAWTFSPASRVWERVATWGTPMPGRELHTTIADPVGDRLVVYGGTDSLGRRGDTWFLARTDPPTWQELGAGPPPPPPPDPLPAFTAQISALPASITIGQSFQVTVSVRNDGFPSDDGRISLGLPGLTDPGDGQWVSMSRAGDSPGLVVSPAGATVRSATCQPMTASYLAAEYADSSWQGFGFETNTVTFTVQPRAVGTFYLDLRATMHRAGGSGCETVNAVPDSGEGGHVDPQGWPVKRFAVAVLPPLTAAKPWFDWSGPPPYHITLGQTFTISMRVKNAGATSDDGRIVFGFPAFTAVGDSANVTCVAGGDLPGYRELPAGSVLSDSTCAPVAASYLTAEYVDNDWLAGGAESNQIDVTVRPREVGAFYIDVRSTMRTAGVGACAYVNGLPSNGEAGHTDPQGWSVRRFGVTVDPPPTAAQPVLTSLTLSPIALIRSQTARISIRATNAGLASDDGRIVVGFPSLTDSADVDQVSGYVTGDTQYREQPAGSAAADSLCAPLTTSYLVVEAVDTDWHWLDEEAHTLDLWVTPRTTGTFYVDVRTTMRTAGAGACAYVNAVPGTGDTLVVDRQGWVVRRFAVIVAEQPPPDPALVVYATPTSIALGQTLVVTSTVTNAGWTSDDGRICVSFPSLTAPADSARVALPAAYGNPSWYHEHPAGYAIERSDCQPMTASHLMVELVDTQWSAQKQQALILQVTPRDTGSFAIRVRSTMHWTVGGPCSYANEPVTAGDTDQQGWPVQTFTVRVNPPPPPAPTFADNVSVPSAISLGDAFTISAAVRNDGAGSRDGRISFAFPSLTDPGDAQWVSSAGASDLPGFVQRPAGSILNSATCQSVEASHLVAEYLDADWSQGETNTVSVMVQPRAEGTFYVDVRATMLDTTILAGPCRYANGLPANGAAGVTDAQGWAVKRFAVEVGPPVGPPSVRWSLIATGVSGPAARALQAAVYDAARDEFVLYGGTALTYTGDSWSLPLPDNSNWISLQPGGPVPLRRIMHSMVYDPVHGSLMIFGGLYDDVLDDLWVLARSPVAWWFPIDPPGVRPSPRMGHAAIYDPVRQRMLVIGGYGRELLNDVWEYSPMVNGTWRQLTPAGTPMPPRATFSAIYDPLRDRVVIFGGDGGAVLDDVWELDLGDSPAWRPITPAGVPPGPRREHTAVYDPQWDEMVVFGGFDVTRRLNDVWTLSLSDAPRWERRTTETLPPAPRSGHSAAYDPVRQRLVVFGGQLSATTYSNEVWELKIDRATPVALSLAETDVGPDHVRLTWFGVGAASLAASLERSTGQDEWFTVGTPSAQGPDQLVFLDHDVVALTRYGYRLRVWQEGKEEVLEPVWVTVPARAELSLAGASPNPVSGAFAVAFSLPGQGPGALELFDLRGRLVARQELAGMAAGPHRVLLADGRHLPAGVYLVRLTHGDKALYAKACVVR